MYIYIYMCIILFTHLKYEMVLLIAVNHLNNRRLVQYFSQQCLALFSKHPLA